MFNLLLEELISLNMKLRKNGISIILGGGMGLFLRESFLVGERSPRYPIRPGSRSTDDLDMLLTADLIANAEKMNALRDVLKAAEYKPTVNFFQFERQIKNQPFSGSAKVDLLAAPPKSVDDVKIKRPRIRPRGSEKIHGYLTDEAAGIGIEAISIDLSNHTTNTADEDAQVCIPSSFNYLILKLHAFYDRKDRSDPGSDEGRHHAFDIFRIITDMRPKDWETAVRHIEQDGDAEYVQNAAKIQRNHFADDTSEGVIRLMENEGYQRHRDEFDGYISDFLDDLEALFTEV